MTRMDEHDVAALVACGFEVRSRNKRQREAKRVSEWRNTRTGPRRQHACPNCGARRFTRGFCGADCRREYEADNAGVTR